MKNLLVILFFYCTAFWGFTQDINAQTMKVWKNGVSTSFDITNVDSVTFSTVTNSPQQDDDTPTESGVVDDNNYISLLSAIYSRMASFFTYEKEMEYMAIQENYGQITPYNSNISQAWSNGYNVINYCNNLIQYAENGNTNTGKYSKHAKSIRALMYYIMAQLWGDIPYFLNVLDPSATVSVGTRQAIISDSYNYLKNNANDLEDIPLSNCLTLNKDNLRPLINEMSMYVDGGQYENTGAANIFIININDGTTYQIVDDNYKQMLDSEYNKYSTSESLSSMWKQMMPHYGVWLALKRLGQYQPINGMSQCLLFPKPQSEIDMNPYISQNEGYNNIVSR